MRQVFFYSRNRNTCCGDLGIKKAGWLAQPQMLGGLCSQLVYE